MTPVFGPVVAELPKLFSSCAGVRAVWSHQKGAFATEPALVLLALTNVEALGQDEVRTEYDEESDGAEFKDTIVARRTGVLRAAVEVYDQSFGVPPAFYLEILRTRLGLKVSQEKLSSLNWAIVGEGQIQDAEGPFDANVVASAVLDLSCTFTYEIGEPEGYTYIAKVSGTETLTEGTTEVGEPFEIEVA